MTGPDAHTTGDDRIVALIRARDEAGLRRLLESHGRRLKGALARRFGSERETQIEDVMSTTALQVWNHIHRFDRSRGSLAGWWYIMACNRIRTAVRSEQARPFVGSIEDDEVRRKVERCLADDAGDNVAYALDAGDGPVPGEDGSLGRLRDCIERLPPKQRLIILADLAAGGSADAPTLARELDSTANSVRVLRHRAHRKLGEMLGEDRP